MPREGQRSKNGERGEHARAIFLPAVLIFGLCTRTGCALVLIFGSSANLLASQTMETFLFDIFVCRCRINGLFGKNSHLRCFVANFKPTGLRVFCAIFLGKKCACANFYTFRMSAIPRCNIMQ